jgi:glycosyltransferase involved in cell wall biosynthesis
VGSGKFHKYISKEFNKIEYKNNVKFIRLPNILGKNRFMQLISFCIFTLQAIFFSIVFGKKYKTVIGSSPNSFVMIPALIHKLIYRSRFIYEVRDLWPEVLIDIKGKSNIFNRIIFKIFTLIESVSIRHADHVVSVKEGDYDYFRDKYNLELSKFSFIPNGMPSHTFINKSNYIDLPKDKLIIGYAGSFGDYYDLNPLIDSMIHISRKDIFLLFIGSGPQKKNLIRKSKELELKNIKFLDSVPKEQLDDYISLFHYGFLPLKQLSSNKYGISCNKLFDYLRLSLPVISYNDCNYDPVTSISKSLKISTYNIDDLVSLLDSLPAKDSLEYKDYAAKANNVFKLNFDMELIAEKYAKVILHERL